MAARLKVDTPSTSGIFTVVFIVRFISPIQIPKIDERLISEAFLPGGDILIHGLPNGWDRIGSAHLLRDWTQGCIAVTNREIEEIWRVVPDGIPVEIRP